MPKFQKKQDHNKPSDGTEKQGPREAVSVAPEESAVPEPLDASTVGPEETQEVKEEKVCGIGGCRTWYDDPVVMKRHRERVHGIGIKNLNKPKPRNELIKMT
jgi:hypothetical protein